MGKRFVLIIYGHSCSGKTSIVEMLMERHINLFRISSDKIKWFISKYNKDEHSEIVYDFLTDLAKRAVKENYSLIVESMGIKLLQQGTKFLKALAKKNGMEFIEINLESPFHIAKERFNARLENAKKEHIKISNKSYRRFKQMYEGYFNKKNEKIPAFDTSKLSPKQIVNRIEKLIPLEKRAKGL